MTDKKYEIIKSLEDDAPFGNVPYYTISFITPQNVESLKCFMVRGFKVHNGYATDSDAKADAETIEKSDDRYDVFVGKMGALHPWDDVNQTESVSFQNEKLDAMEQKRRETENKNDLIRQQIINDKNTFVSMANNKAESERMQRVQKRIMRKLYEKGKISEREYQNFKNDRKGTIYDLNQRTELIKQVADLSAAINESSKVDYLDENTPKALKWGCFTIYSPFQIVNLKGLCYKIRGLFETRAENKKRLAQLRKRYPHDRTYEFEMGKWCAFSEHGEMLPEELNAQLNYCMKIYSESIKKDAKEFEERCSANKKLVETEALEPKRQSRSQRRNKLRRDKKKKTEIPAPATATDTVSNSKSELEATMINADDKDSIQKILDFLEDPELKGKYVSREQGETMTIDIPTSNTTSTSSS